MLRLQDYFYQTIAFLLVILLIILAITSVKNMSFTMDEGNYLNNGEILVKDFNWDHYVTRFHPPLTFYYHGLLTLFNFPGPGGDKLFYARLLMMPVLTLFALTVFLTAKNFYGIKAGTLALFLFCFDPNILAHGRLITPDLTLAFFIFLFLVMFYKFIVSEKADYKKAIVAGIILGLALLTKYNGLMLFPLSLLFFYCFIVLKIIKRQKINYYKFVGLVVIYVLAIYVVNLGYGFKSSFTLPEEFKTKLFQNFAQNSIASNLMKVFPGIYLTGTDYQLFESQRDFYWEFFWGKRYSKGPWFFYPLSFLIKSPIPLLFIILLFLLFLYKKDVKKTFFEFCLAFSGVFFFVYFSFFNRLINGFRYVLMVYPLIFVLTSQLVNINFVNKNSKKAFNILLIILLVWEVVGTLKIQPHYLAFVNEFVGGPKNAYKYYADSNLDWGQNWILLSKFKEKNKEPIVDDPRKPVIGKIMVSVNTMNLYNYEDYEWLRKLKKEPIANIGYTWLIFDITKNDLEKLKYL
jgi:4-amino-4-deoxy-L-arabinose transferase-like glycosyltransferase